MYLGTQMKTVHKRLLDNYWSSVGLGEPPGASCKSIISEGGGKCWISSVFYLLTEKNVVSTNTPRAIQLNRKFYDHQ